MGDETILTVRKNRIGPLISDDKVQLQHDEMAEEFNRYFTSVFTKENTAEIPSAAPLFQSSEYEKLCDIYIDGSLVRKKLDRLRTDKAPGVDSLLPRVLVELKK